ncbi:phosphogluconate dehydratase [Paremcibacter congregatus]|uniref:Phosphogluconate dehydratase n=1 Tax=Paremcibacter congregatus TaxID=2043170 RepID=A0A2G4YRD8_9PROT|nr:phosphogluconate dehydratase [Paremcibacter congregatus]PHZ84830.1 phosphogluconate dehydratase [Paremcibacter congregatus]QDE26197.1 phosphogluconate dehydratase [Paremcibacter congregatus]
MTPELQKITDRIIARSCDSRAAYLAKITAARGQGRTRGALACGNLAHAFAACDAQDKADLSGDVKANYAIVSAYNDMLSAHQPFQTFPDLIKETARAQGAVAQFAGGVPAMCDGVTQGRAGMELSLFSRDVIAMATAIALSHDMFDGAFYLGVCDKIVPGLLIGALSFGHLPGIFVPAGPMTSGLSNAEKARIRQLYAQGKIGRAELLKAESASYHSPGTCTFYGTANSNQMLMEIMGLHLPGSSFINPGTDMRDAMTRAAVVQLAEAPALGEIIDEKAMVNGMVGLLATGGSTNHTLHLMAIGRAAGVKLTWQDLSDLSDVVPSLTRIYPNGLADVNHFHAAGGMAYLMRELRDAGLLHDDVQTVMGRGLEAYCKDAFFEAGEVVWKDGAAISHDRDILRPVAEPFSKDGGLKLLGGNLGRAVIKTSAVKEKHRHITAPAIVFHSQDEMLEAYQRGELEKDFVAVIRFQGPKANGMPELHKLTPSLGVLQDKGFHVALVTDGRMSGASGKVPAAIHLTPEALDGGPIGRIEDGDIIELDAEHGTLQVKVADNILAQRAQATADLTTSHQGMGRELFSAFRQLVGTAENGAGVFGEDDVT